MSRKVLSMRGETVDFDLFLIRDQINGAPLTETIENREKFIDVMRRRKKSKKRKLQDLINRQMDIENEAVEAGEESGETTEVVGGNAPASAKSSKPRIIKKDNQ
jgi:hypothetical protein